MLPRGRIRRPWACRNLLRDGIIVSLVDGAQIEDLLAVPDLLGLRCAHFPSSTGQTQEALHGLVAGELHHNDAARRARNGAGAACRSP